MSTRRGPWFLLAWCWLGMARAGTVGPDDEFFEKEVRPVLVERCLSCHDEAKAKGGLRLTSRAAILRGGESGAAAVAGHADDSLLVRAIRHDDEPRMPPKRKLSDREIATLVRWVDRGLHWPEAPGQAADETRRFWAFQPLGEPSPRGVVDASWPRSEIDRYILAFLEAKGRKPSPPADRRTLLRRATFDLIGLPPTPDEVEAFLADDAPDAFARVIDRLLASPQYGERWGRYWLDVVRYADARDARGLGGASDIAEAWRYRDWVVNAFNDDLPYDRFLIDQIAGDLIPSPSPGAGAVNTEGLIATGLLAIGEWGTGDADKEKMMTDIVDDQIDVVGRAFLGLTLACARCHDHKFDPIPTEDYYGLAGIFFSTHILPDPGPKTNGSPLLRTPLVPLATIEKAKGHKTRLDELEKRLKAETKAAYADLSRRLLHETARYMLAARDCSAGAQGERAEGPDGLATERGLNEEVLRRWIDYLGFGGDGRLLTNPVANVRGAAGVFGWKGEPDCPSLIVNTNAAAITMLTFTLPPRSVAVHPGPTSGVAVTWRSPLTGTVRVAGKLADADPVGGDGVAWVLAHRRGGVSRTIAEGDLANGGAQRLDAGHGSEGLEAVSVREGDVIRLVVLPKKGHTCDTTTVDLAIRANDGPATWDLALDLLSDPLAGGRGNPHADREGHPGTWSIAEVSDRPAAAVATGLAEWDRAIRSGDPGAIERAADAVQRAVDKGTHAALIDELLSIRGPLKITPKDNLDGLDGAVIARLAKIRDERDALRKVPPPPIPVALAAQEGGVPGSPHAGFHDARIHVRGNYQRLGPTVPRHFPRVLAGDGLTPSMQGSGRLELARWIARPDHPLTARVMVNRIWQYHFGAGIVRTPSNFGMLGERPDHPELLDALALRFVASGWSVKAMHRAIMLSSTYQQSSTSSEEALRADPENRGFGRMDRRRLESEAIRDSLLSVSGRLDRALGGPSIRSLESPRRTLYLMTIRSDRSSFGPLFDAADATAMVDRRTVSTVAPQALFLLNDPFVLDVARQLSRRILDGAPADQGARIERAYALLFGRPPTADEVEIGMRLLADGGSAAWEEYAQVLLCTNEFIYVD